MLRQMRSERGWTLAELSLRTGLPISTLSKIENGKMSLSYDKLARISEGLEVGVGEIFNDVKAPVEAGSPGQGRRSITRLGEGGRIETPSYSHIYHATDLLHKKFVPLLGEIKHRRIEDVPEMIRHDGEEYTLVLEGALEFHCDLYAPVILKKGESIYFDSSMAHAYIAIGDERCTVLSVCAGPGIEMPKFPPHGASTAGAETINIDLRAPAPAKRPSTRAAGKRGSRG
jgi:transcriptional regulator with XRE-family HTH domain